MKSSDGRLECPFVGSNPEGRGAAKEDFMTIRALVKRLQKDIAAMVGVHLKG